MKFKRLAPAAALVATILMAPGEVAARGAPIAEATAEQKSAAKEKYKVGMAAFAAEKFDEALIAFRESYDTVASPNSHLMVARAIARLGRHGEAHRELKSVILEAEAAALEDAKYAKAADAARAELEELTAKTGFITVEVQASLVVEGREVPPSEWGGPIAVSPGAVEVKLTTTDGLETVTQVTVEAGQGTAVAVEPPKPPPVSAPPPPPPNEPEGIDQRTLAYVAGGVGVAGMATFGIFGILANSKFDDIDSQCADNLCPAGLADEAEQGRRFQTAANVGLGIGAVGLVTGVVLFFTAPTKAQEAPTALSLPRVDIGARSVSVSGRF